VWLPANADDKIIYPGCQVSLAVVSYFQAELVICYKVYNGIEVQIGEWRVQQCDPRLQNLFGAMREFQKFRLSACQSNVNVREKAVGTKYSSLCFGDIEGFPRVHYVWKQKKGTLIGDIEHEVEVLPSAPGTQLVSSGVRVDDLEEEEDKKEKSGELLLTSLGTLAAVSITYFALQ
jgi:hypothetical protein